MFLWITDHTETAVLGHADRQTGLGDGIHRRRDDRQIQSNARTGQEGADVDRIGVNLGTRGHEEDVVESQADRNFVVHYTSRRAGPGGRGLGAFYRSDGD